MSLTLQYIKNNKGETTGVIIDIHEYESLMEDIEDLAACAERRNEETVPHDQFLAELRKDGIL